MKKIFSIVLVLMMTLSLCFTVRAESEIPFSESWKMSVSSYHGDNFNIDKAFDDDINTYWHTRYTAKDGSVVSHENPPFEIKIEFGETLDVSGWKYTPRTDNGTGTVTAYSIYATKDGEKYVKIFEGKFDYIGGVNVVREPSTASWGSYDMSGIIIYVTEGLGGYGTAAEIDFLTGTSGEALANGEEYKGIPEEEPPENGSVPGTELVNDGWEITASSETEGQPIARAFDGGDANFWHTGYEVVDGKAVSVDAAPFKVTVNFGKMTKVSGWLYYPRTDNATGVFMNYTIQGSTDGVNFKDIYTGSFDYVAPMATDFKPSGASWGDTEVTAIRILATKTRGDNHATACEIKFFTGGEKVETAKPADKPAASGTSGSGSAAGRVSSTGLKLLPKSGWKLTVNSDNGNSIGKALDGDVNTYWHSHYTHAGPTITGHDNPPYYLELTLPEVTEISGVVLVPRQDVKNGLFYNGNLYVSDSDDGEYFLLKPDLAFSNSLADREMLFVANLKVKRVKFEATATQGGYGCLAEFDLVEKNADMETVAYEEYDAMDRLYALYEIDRYLFNVEYEGTNWATNWAEHEPQMAFDGVETSFWQTDEVEKDTVVSLKVDMQRVIGVKEIVYIPRQSADCHGCWMGVSIWGSKDGETWEPVKEGLTYEKDITTKTITLDEEVYYRYFEFEIYDYFASRVSAAEIKFFQSRDAKDKLNSAEGEEYVLKIGSKDITYKNADGEGTKTIDVAPYIVNGSTLIPLRGLLELMGAEITWDGNTQKIGLDNGIYEMTLQICNKLVYVKDPKYGNIKYTLLNFPVITDNRTFIPVRFVSEQLGYKVAWDGESQTITITK
ncbi:MAG: discoidin domain-containing protein [Clostridia bacterium]|nr:discoidin domain-containing protein [Clostridia bacterium]